LADVQLNTSTDHSKAATLRRRTIAKRKLTVGIGRNDPRQDVRPKVTRSTKSR
jgi:hypothetical protein